MQLPAYFTDCKTYFDFITFIYKYFFLRKNVFFILKFNDVIQNFYVWFLIVLPFYLRFIKM